MTYEEALKYIHSVSRFGSNLGLTRINALLTKLGNPEKDLKCIHVAGTNGKGSVSAMCASVLQKAGYNVGLYTSPFIVRFNERIRLNGKDIPDDELAEIVEKVKEASASVEGDATEFELITAAAFLYYKRHNVDVVVLEVGMGGRLDATNVIKSPIVSVITGIALDHTAILGDTVEKIAFEKAGIIKETCPVVYGGRDDKAFAVIKKRAEELGCDIVRTNIDSINIKSETVRGSVFDYKDKTDINISLCGSYQPENAATAIEALRFAAERGFDIPEKVLREGIAETRWRARFELLEDKTPVIFDGSHNIQGVTAAVKSVKQCFGDKKITLLMGVLADKDYKDMVSLLSEISGTVFTVTPASPRALAASSLAETFNSFGVKAVSFDDTVRGVASAYAYARAKNTPLIMLGSLYMYGDVYNAFEKVKIGRQK